MAKEMNCNDCGKPLFDQDPEELTNLCDECVKNFAEIDEAKEDALNDTRPRE